MQVFSTYSCPVKSAKYLDNKRVVKMVLESSQLMSNAMHLKGKIGPYKLTHKNHPLTNWVLKSEDNYLWLYTHYIALCNEYTKRFKKVHKCSLLRDIFAANTYANSIENVEFVNCTDFKDIEDVHLAYRKCLRKKWKNDKIKPKWR